MFIFLFVCSLDTFKSELQAVISECRRTRSFVDNVCTDLLKQTVTVTDVRPFHTLTSHLNVETVSVLAKSKYTSVCFDVGIGRKGMLFLI